MATPSVSYGFVIYSGHDHPGRPQHLVAEPVALLQHLQHGALLGPLAGLREQRLVDVRVEGALGLDLREPVPLDEAEQRAVDEPDALLELRLLVLGGSLERPLQVVEHRQQLVQEPLVRAAGQLDLLARDALAVVVEVGGETQVGVVRRLRRLGSQ